MSIAINDLALALRVVLRGEYVSDGITIEFTDRQRILMALDVIQCHDMGEPPSVHIHSGRHCLHVPGLMGTWILEK